MRRLSFLFFVAVFCVLAASPVSAALPGIGQGFSDIGTANSNGMTFDEIQELLKNPKLQVDVPGLSDFVPLTIEENLVEDGGSLYITIPYLGQYIASLYTYAIVVAAVLAVLMLIASGIQMMAGALSEDQVTSAKKRIQGAVIGLGIAATSYLLLFAINPELVRFKHLKVLYVPGETLDEIEIVPAAAAQTSTSGGSGKGIQDLIGPQASPVCTKKAAQDAANKLFALSICVGPCHCAYAASQFLNYIGCTNVYSNQASHLPGLLLQSGWREMPVTADNHTKLPVGLLVAQGSEHTGVSLGDGNSFESTTISNGFNKKNETKGTCPVDVKESVANPNACSFCALLSGHGPETGNWGDELYLAGQKTSGDFCKSNQEWVVKKVGQRLGKKNAWVKVIYPPDAKQGGPQW